ncbi:uncharacterized protein LOC142964611 [Anarhichas minor]|uniref:uncharacterized protein LOC142964611 n=1 Tax=Anarhichas minor TaxID=65739 RepID=UPI003F73CCDE
MPSKRKKNQRRMRRVQAQRRALEEEHANDPPAKASPGIAVSAPPAAISKKAAKTPAPVKIPVAVPIVVPTVKIPIVKPEPVVKEPVSVPVAEPVPVPVPVEEPVSVPVTEPIAVEVVVPETEAVVLEQTPAEVEVEVPAPVTEEPPVVEATPAEPPIVEAAIVQEAEPIIPESEPVTEAIPPAEAPVAAPVEIEIQTKENIIETTETEQTYDVCEPETVETEVAITEDIATPEPVTETTEEPAAEAPTCDQVPAEEVVTETLVQSVEEVVAETHEPEQETEAVASPAAPAEDEDDEAEIEVLAEPVALTEDAPAPCVEIPVVPDTVPEAPIEEAEALVTEVKESFADTMVDDFVVTESLSAADVAIAESAAVQPEIVEVSNTESESMDVMPAAVAAPAEEIDTGAEQICLEVLSEEPKLEICHLPCQMQLAVESVQLSSIEMSVEASLNGHIAPEVSIEG